jgi:serine/threonine-protein kinase
MEHKLRGPDHPGVATAANNLAALLMRLDKHDEAEVRLREALDIRRRHFGESHPQTLNSLYSLAGLHLARGQCDQAESVISAALEGASASLPEGHWHVGVFLARRGECLLCLGRAADAVECLRESSRLLEQSLGPDRDHTQRAFRLLADAYDAMGDADQAAQWRGRLAPDGPAGAP